MIAKPRSTSACKPWLKIFPDQGVLVPTESIEISFTVLVNSESAGPLNFNQETLSDIVILRLENGTDHYVILFLLIFEKILILTKLLFILII